MARINKPEDCSCGEDFIKLAEKRQREGLPVEIKNGGRHAKIKVPGKGSMPVSVHSKDLGKGLKRAMIKQWYALGLGIFLVLMVVLYVS